MNPVYTSTVGFEAYLKADSEKIVALTFPTTKLMVTALAINP